MLKLLNCGKASRVTRGVTISFYTELGVPPFNKAFVCVPGHC